MASFRVGECKISVRSGSEGPRHDPYGYDEIVVSTPSKTVVLHRGLGVWLSVNGQRRLPNYQWYREQLMLCGRETAYRDAEQMAEFMLERRFKLEVGIDVDEVMERHWMESLPRDQCQHCGSFDLQEAGGYVGETVQTCRTCGKVVWWEEVTKAMIE